MAKVRAAAKRAMASRLGAVAQRGTLALLVGALPGCAFFVDPPPAADVMTMPDTDTTIDTASDADAALPTDVSASDAVVPDDGSRAD